MIAGAWCCLRRASRGPRAAWCLADRWRGTSTLSTPSPQTVVGLSDWRRDVLERDVIRGGRPAANRGYVRACAVRFRAAVTDEAKGGRHETP
jgi:hypothetical protein